MDLVLTGLFFIGIPYFILFLTKKSKLLEKIGAVLLCYAIGLAVGISGILPEGSDELREMIMSATTPLALPLLLFGSNMKQWIKLAGKTLLSMLLAIIALISIVVAAWLLFGDYLPGSWQVSGLLIGLYTGGTPNLASIQTALDISPEIYLTVNTYDIFLSAIFLLLIMSTGRKLISWLLPVYKTNNSRLSESDFTNKPGPLVYKRLIFSVLASVAIAGISVGLSFFFFFEISMLIVILSITSLSILGSLIPFLNKTSGNFDAGMYLILIFSVTVASLVDIDDFMNISPALFWFVATVIFGTLVLHVILSAIFKLDTDTTLITATALICSPPFVPVIAGVLKNKQIIISGLTVGIIGYAIGNYLGVLIAIFIKGFG